MAKRIRISRDDGATWRTLPGNSGEFNTEMGQLEDTIFGADYESNFPGIGSWTIDANAIIKGYAGYMAKIMRGGTPTAMTGEATSLISGKTYQITSTTRRVIDRNAAVSVLDNGDAVDAADIESIDYLFGRVTFASGYTVTGPITITGQYIPMEQVARGNSYTLTQTANAIDDTDFETAQANDGLRKYVPGLKTVALELGGIYDESNDWSTILFGRDELLIEIDPTGTGKSVARGFFRANTQGQSGDVGAQEEETVSFSLSVPDVDNMEAPFRWAHTNDTPLNLAVRDALAAWQDEEVIMIAYIPDGAVGKMGEGVITDLTLSGGLDGMNEFTVSVQGSDGVSAYDGG
jgi:hypothetical protein